MRKVSENPLAGTQVWHDYDETLEAHHFVTHYSKDYTQAVFDRNAALSGTGMGKEWRLAASIPPVMIADMIAAGADPFSADPDVQKKARAWLNSNENNKARVNGFKI
jgi:hypothetical protein